MSFAFHAAGTKDQVHAQLDDAVKQHLKYSNPPEEIEQAAGIIKHWLNKAGYPTGVYVESHGHLDSYGGSLQLTIKPLNIPKHEPAVAGE